MLIVFIKSTAPPSLYLPDCTAPAPSDDNNPSILEELKCSICWNLVCQPMELPCRALVCAQCFIDWLTASACVQCPCCTSDEALVPAAVKPASALVLMLLREVMVHCANCNRDVKAHLYSSHQCVPSPTRDELQTAASILKRAISSSPKQSLVTLPTGGTVKCKIMPTSIYYHYITHYLISQ